MTINGNVDTFAVTNNLIHNNDNIAIRRSVQILVTWGKEFMYKLQERIAECDMPMKVFGILILS